MTDTRPLPRPKQHGKRYQRAVNRRTLILHNTDTKNTHNRTKRVRHPKRYYGPSPESSSIDNGRITPSRSAVSPERTIPLETQLKFGWISFRRGYSLKTLRTDISTDRTLDE